MNLQLLMQSALSEVAKVDIVEEEAVVASALPFEGELLITTINHEKNKEESREQILKANFIS